jgi:spore germination protein
MIIHVVQEGEDINSIAESYGVSVERLVLENDIENPDRLIIGEALVILYPEITYTIQEGDTLGGIAEAYGVTVMQLLRNNSYLTNREYIYPGETIVISYKEEKISTLATNGYAYPFIDHNTLRKTLPYLTFLTIFTYMYTAEGELDDIDDIELIRIAKEYGVAPIMSVSPFGENDADKTAVVHDLLRSEESMERLIQNILLVAKSKGYYAVNIDNVYIFPEERVKYVDYMENISTEFNNEGYNLYNTFSLSSFELITGVVYQGLDYKRMGEFLNGAIFLSYDWGFKIGIPANFVAPDTLNSIMDYATSQIPAEKSYVGSSGVGYIWQLPYIEGVSRGQSMTYASVRRLASEVGATFLFDDVMHATYFQIINELEEVVRFKDARYYYNLIRLVKFHGYRGLGVWNIMQYFAPVWLVINSQYEIEKIF